MATLTDQDAAVFKEALRARGDAAAAGVKTWHVITVGDAQSAADFLNIPPEQGAGEASLSNRADGSVDVYYFL
jgi:hypothetical protein